MTNNTQTPESALATLGFTDTEAAIYCELLRGAPSTGYRLALSIGKSPANVYQALANLTSRGAVMVEDGETKTYRATPPKELLSGLQRAFELSRHEAHAALAGLHAHAEDDRIYQLKTTAQVYERAQRMIVDAREIILFDLFPTPLATLAPVLSQAHGRGVNVAGLAYADSPDLPFPVSTARSRSVVAERWPGLQLSLIVDASEHLTALLSPDGMTTLRGVWSDSVYLACLQHSGLAAEIQISATSYDSTDRFAGISLLRAYPPGLKTLIGPITSDSK